jgi:hypothetical protein
MRIEIGTPAHKGNRRHRPVDTSLHTSKVEPMQAKPTPTGTHTTRCAHVKSSIRGDIGPIKSGPAEKAYLYAFRNIDRSVNTIALLCRLHLNISSLCMLADSAYFVLNTACSWCVRPEPQLPTHPALQVHNARLDVHDKSLFVTLIVMC